MSGSPDRRPTLWIVAGPNGSGKSTIYSMMSAQEPAGSIWIINPDELSSRIERQEQLPQQDANLEAVKRIEHWLYASVHAHQTVGVETVLSTDKYRRLVLEAKRRGFVVRMIFVFLSDPQLNVERVRIRVLKGGHDVPEDRIRSRWTRSFGELAWHLGQADRVDVFDNSGAEPRRVITKDGDVLSVFETLIPALEHAIRTAFGESVEGLEPPG
ncbi:MAG: zeta toxin family protein [Brevundimonas sp.]|uniref:AAA family ATPase n=1 Tax=Brevundimonas sp. TaxID=1871086 RepID=UPI0022BEEAAB|nr:AAA family ATPase [Brevundimonas sp.]MCZ8086983.1 zeta toxin family protein [Brevundimonas sp.]MCZ8193668.1 zeta toxin family protein [Brevundimonas sp.]